MLLDIPAVASTEGAVTAVTWRASGVYPIPSGCEQVIQGRVVSGTFTLGEDLYQGVTGYQTTVVAVNGENIVISGPMGSVAPNASQTWVGQTSSAIFQPISLPAIGYRNSLYIDTPFRRPYLVQFIASEHNSDGYDYTLTKNPPQGSVIKLLTCAEPTFQIPVWARGGTVYNRSGADMFIRAYRPNVEANVIDTTAATFGESGIVGLPIGDGGYYSFDPGGFTPGTSWMLCAASAAVGGAVVEFNP